ncbi:MAG: AsnC family transcriptional regulator [Candidatus Bathyarchaeia archaeon]
MFDFNASALSTETVRLEEQYAAVEQKILKDLDSMNIKIFSAMWKLGARNLLEVSRQTGIPFTSVYHRIERLESKSGPLAYVVPKISRLGMVRVVVLATARLGCEEAVTQALKAPNLWQAINSCEGTFTHDSVHSVPVGSVNEFRAYIHQLATTGLIKRFKIILTGNYLPNFPDFTYYDPATHQWTFPWDRWYTEIIDGDATSTVDDPEAYSVSADKKDLQIIEELELNARKSFSELAPKVGISLHGVKYHFDKRLVPNGIIQNIQFNVVPYPKEVTAFHEIMLEFNSKLDMDKFYSAVPRLFFVIGVSKILGRNAILLRTYILESQLSNLFKFFSQLAKVGMLQSYSAVRKQLKSRIVQTISSELFDEEKGWILNLSKSYEELEKLKAAYVK